MPSVNNILIEPMQVLLDGVDVGCTDGTISYSLDEAAFAIVCHQTGATELSRLRTAFNFEVSMILKEVSTAQLDSLLQYAGQSYTPAGGTAVTAIGTDRVGTSQFTDANTLILHPVGAGTDYTRDHTFWKAYPTINSITWSGEEPVQIDVTFAIFRDETKVAQADMYVFGDTTSVTQDFT